MRPIIKRHGKFTLTDMKHGLLYIKGKEIEFRIIKSMGKKYMVLQNEAISFRNFDELFSKLKQRGVRVITGYDKYGKSHATIVL
ncbi:hypothetical protein [Thermofilum sp.]|jgi:hypothetical protein|uniref:hypothetical protein n=1 Tax=Thermofilum sp. TaxID=1961369 RepID=UPI002590CB84|nr:hypothetical protein [Thermofilum sp.]